MRRGFGGGVGGMLGRVWGRSRWVGKGKEEGEGGRGCI